LVSGGFADKLPFGWTFPETFYPKWVNLKKMMDKVISIEKRIKRKKQKKQLESYRGKLEGVQKVIQCSACQHRCAMCGHYLKDSDATDGSSSTSLGFTLCECCKSEFEDFLAISREKRPANIYWHNKEWLKMWSAWLDYRQAIDGFVNSREFKSLLEELGKKS
jgi:hypothetical protein